MASDFKKRIDEAASFLRSRCKISPEIGIILGTGLGQLATHLQADATIEYSEIPRIPASSPSTDVTMDRSRRS